MPMDKLAPIIVNRARDHGFKLIIVDPLYKVLTGDENSAGDMSKLCNCFDFVSRETDVRSATVIITAREPREARRQWTERPEAVYLPETRMLCWTSRLYL